MSRRDPTDPDLASHVLEGLSAQPKALSSKWFYDDEGSRLFQRIMELPSYYLTRVERALLQTRTGELVELIRQGDRPVDLVELGSGDGSKTLILLRALAASCPDCTYHPMDISQHALDELTTRLAGEVPGMRIEPVCGDYFHAWPEVTSDHRQVAMFLGSNLGNFDRDGATDLLRRIRAQLRPGDALILGLDLMKDPAVVLRAYDDPEGVTARFNLNLLTRLNRELGMDFDLERFRHYATYCPLSGDAQSFLVSTTAQTVSGGVLGREFGFREGEVIHTELSRKFDRDQVVALASAAGFELAEFLTDTRAWYGLAVCEAISDAT